MTLLNLKPKHVDFAVVCFGHFASLFGSNLTIFALGVWVYQQTGSATQFTLISTFAMLPGVLISPLAGALVDRWDRRRVLIVSDGVSAVVTLLTAGLLYTHQLATWHIWAGAVVNSAVGAFFRPAFAASITLIVPRQQYGRANGILQSGYAIVQIATPVLAGVLVSALQLWGVLLIDFVTFGVAVVTLLLIHIPRPQASAETQGRPRSLKHDIAYGWTYITSRPGLLGLLIFFAITNFILGIVQVLITPLVLGFADAVVLGRVLTTAGLGLLLGGVVMSIWGGPRQRVLGILGGTLLQGLLLFLGGLQPNAWLVALAVAVFLFSSQIVIGCSQAIWQSKVAPDVQGRVFAVRTMIAWSSLPAAYTVAGPLADYVFGPWLLPGGALSASLGPVIGVGPGRGIGLLYTVMGVLIVLTVIAAYLYPRLRWVEREIPDTVIATAAP